jgi:hypothetical protein
MRDHAKPGLKDLKYNIWQLSGAIFPHEVYYVKREARKIIIHTRRVAKERGTCCVGNSAISKK